MRALLPLLACLLGGCSTTMQLPADFLQLRGESGFKSVTADDARVWIREFADPNEGKLEFWTESLDRDLAGQRGYAPVGKGEVKDADGRAGRWLEYSANVRGEKVGYLIAVFVLDKSLLRQQHVRVVEFSAREAVYAARVAAVRAALATVH